MRGISLPLPKGHAQLDSYVVAGLPFPEGTLQTAKTETTHGVDPVYDCTKKMHIMRTRHFQRFIERKKITFEV